MRVLVATSMYPSEARPAFGTFVRTQVESLRAIGVDVDLFVLDGPTRGAPMYARAIVDLRRRLRAGTPVDLVHAHYGYVGAVARTQWRVPVVVTFHGDDLLGTVGERGRTTRTSRVVAAGGRVLGRTVDAAIVQTVAMAHLLRGGPRVHVIPHEVDLESFRPAARDAARAALGLPLDRGLVLFAADPRIPVKNFPLARAAVDVLGRRDPGVELVVVHREPQPRLVAYMNACDVLAFPSHQEGSPNIVKQAMACNLPIVSTDVGDVRELIDGTDGCFVVPPDATAFAGRLGDALARARRTDGRARVAHLGRREVARRVVSVYEQVLRRRPRAGVPAGVGG